MLSYQTGLFISTGAVSLQLRLRCDASVHAGSALLSSQGPSICHINQGQRLSCCECTPSSQSADNRTDDTCALNESSSFRFTSGLIR